MIPHSRKYIILIVHYGSHSSTDRLIKALLMDETTPHKVIVIDHDKDKYETPFSSEKLTIFRPSSNEGYAAGLNIGLGSLLNDGTEKDDMVICMNNDVQISNGFLSSVKKWWQENPEPSLMGVKDGFVNLLSGRSLIGSSPDWYKIRYLHGSLIAAPYEVFATLHGWPDSYFLYWEDVLMSRKANKKKIPLRINKEMYMDHDDDVREKYTDDQMYYLVRNGALFLQNETPFLWRKWWWLVNKLRLVWHKYINPKSDRTVVAALSDAINGISGKRKYE